VVAVREWLVLLAVGLGTYAARAVFLVTLRSEPSPVVARALTYVAPAVLAAIMVPALVAPGGTVSVAATLPGLIFAAICWLLWRRTKSFPLALLGGLAVGFAIAVIL
jgi:branched-subunit amino acid transport protein